MLYNSTSDPVAWTMTDSYGNYTFENIAFDTYKIVTEKASATAESVVNLTSNNSNANADMLLRSPQTNTDISNTEDILLSIYPNPLVDKLIITLKESENVAIYNPMGQLLLLKSLKSSINILDLSTINKGVYFAKIGKTTIKVIKK